MKNVNYNNGALLSDNTGKIKRMLTPEEKNIIDLFSEIIVNKTFKDIKEQKKNNTGNDQ